MPTVEEELVAQIFVRINSKGKKLSAADFILTLLSVFWDEGRAQLETFSRTSRLPAGPKEHSPFNHLIFPEPDQLLRVSIAVGFHRARLKTMYQVLRGKDLDTDQFSDERRDSQCGRLKTAQSHVLDLTHWHSFINAIVATGCRTRELISSETALIDAYALYLLGKLQCNVDQHVLDRIIGRWFFATALTSRYSGQSETTFEEDLVLVRDARAPKAFVDSLDGALSRMVTSDFWTIRLPDELEVSSNQGPAVRSTKKALEFHHLFPRDWLKVHVSEDTKITNQAANFALLEWPDNVANGGNRPPSEHVPGLRERFSDETWARMMRLHALPQGWESLVHDEFLRRRRVLMAGLIQRAYEKLSDIEAEEESLDPTAEERAAWERTKDVEIALRRLVWARYSTGWNERSDAQVQKVLGEDAWKTIEKNRAKHAEHYPQVAADDPTGVLQFSYLGQLVQLMVTNEAWEMFKPMFRDRRELEDLVRKITPVRNDAAHFRAVPVQQLRSCQVACEELKTLLSAAERLAG